MAPPIWLMQSGKWLAIGILLGIALASLFDVFDVAKLTDQEVWAGTGVVPPQLRGSDIRDVCVDLVGTSDSRISIRVTARPPPAPPRTVCVSHRDTVCVPHRRCVWSTKGIFDYSTKGIIFD